MLGAEEFGVGTDSGSDRRDTSRLSGSAGAVFTAWSSEVDNLKLFASYRNTFKPAAVDFGLDAAPEILEPERLRAAFERLPARYQDVLTVLSATGLHWTELARFVHEGELVDGLDGAVVVVVAVVIWQTVAPRAGKAGGLRRGDSVAVAIAGDRLRRGDARRRADSLLCGQRGGRRRQRPAVCLLAVRPGFRLSRFPLPGRRPSAQPDHQAARDAGTRTRGASNPFNPGSPAQQRIMTPRDRS